MTIREAAQFAVLECLLQSPNSPREIQAFTNEVERDLERVVIGQWSLASVGSIACRAYQVYREKHPRLDGE